MTRWPNKIGPQEINGRIRNVLGWLTGEDMHGREVPLPLIEGDGTMSEMKITGLEANFLLFCLDAYCDVNMKGKLTKAGQGYSLEALQDLRDRMFAIHEHPDEDDDDE